METLPYTPKLKGESDQPLDKQLVDLEKINAEGYMRVVHHKGERGYHIKLVLNDKEAISLFVWNEKAFKGENTLARSYGVIPIEEIEPDEGDEILAEGSYSLINGVLTLRFEKGKYKGSYSYKLKLKGIREYISPKHGLSVRPEYFLIAL